MNGNEKKVEELVKRMEELSRKQDYFSREIKMLSQELEILKSEKPDRVQPLSKTIQQPIMEPVEAMQQQQEKPIDIEPPKAAPVVKKKKEAADWEKIIGESWISKLGILITVIGVFVGAKYTIENDLISPLTRIILGYLAGTALLLFGIKLKAKYESYSAVLVSGAMAVFYFITFFGYDFYGLFPKLIAYGLMLVFTVFTVLASLNYNRSVIAVIGLVGAYAIPFLLSDNSGKVEVLLAYVLLVNLGILAVSVKKYWKSLYYTSFFFTWIIYSVCYFSDYNFSENTLIALLFATVFFLIFYVVIIANRVLSESKLSVSNIIVLLLNSFIYFAMGYAVLNRIDTEQYLGLFSLFNALVHFAAGIVIRNKKLADTSLYYLVFGLVFVFITIAVPIQLDGNWVTLLWIAQAVLLFWIGRTKGVSAYENISYAVMFLAFFSLIHDWMDYDYWEIKKAFLNITFLTSVLVASGYGFILYLNGKQEYITEKNKTGLSQVMGVFIPIMLVVVSYFTFSNEISLYFSNWMQSTGVEYKGQDYSYTNLNYSIEDLKLIFLFSYSVLFFVAVSFINILKVKSKALGILGVIFILLTLFIAQTAGIIVLGDLRIAYIDRELNENFVIGFGYVLIRYVLFAGIALGVFTLFKKAGQEFMNPLNKGIGFCAELAMYLSVLCFLSNELVTWLDIAGSKGVFKLWLSILWGVYALALIYFGIIKQKKYLRIGAIVLFAFTLLKLFFYDISHLNTISKTIVLVCLGVLLLIISFLYTKFKDKISDNEQLK